MQTAKQQLARKLAADEGRRINNFADCDVIQEALMQLEEGDDATDAQMLDSFVYLATAVRFRGYSSKVIEGYQRNYAADVKGEKCKHQGAPGCNWSKGLPCNNRMPVINI